MPLNPDPRSAAYPLMESFWPTALISLAYVVGVYTWMKMASPKKKKATTNGHASNGNAVSKKEVSKASLSSSYDIIKVLMVVYNIVMIFYSAFLVIEVLDLLRITGYGLGCVEFDPKDDPIQRRFIRVGYLFYFSKFLELLDTLFFLLRGKYDQVTFLHVFHHGAMPPSIWWGIKYAPGEFFRPGLPHLFLCVRFDVFFDRIDQLLRSYMRWLLLGYQQRASCQ